MTTNEPDTELTAPAYDTADVLAEILAADDKPDLLAEILATQPDLTELLADTEHDALLDEIADQIAAEQDEILPVILAVDAETERIMAPYLEQNATDMAAIQAMLIAAENPVTASLTDTADQDARLSALIGSVDDPVELPEPPRGSKKVPRPARTTPDGTDNIHRSDPI